MCTNTGEQKMKLISEILGMDKEAWLDKESVANVVAFVNLSNQYQITYDNAI